MIDVDLWQSLEEILSVLDHNKRPKATGADNFGAVHVILFGDFKSGPWMCVCVLCRVLSCCVFVLRFSTQATSTGDVACPVHYNTVRGRHL